MFGITLRSTGHAAPFWDLVDAASAFEAVPSIRALGYAPHITLARYPDIDPTALKAALAIFAGERPFLLTFDRIAAFDADQLVLWLSPRADPRLVAVHEALHRAIDRSLCDPHYLPGAWTPHLTIAAAIQPEQRAGAQHLLARGITPFTLSFEMVDCLHWPPVTLLAEHPLR